MLNDNNQNAAIGEEAATMIGSKLIHVRRQVSPLPTHIGLPVVRSNKQ